MAAALLIRAVTSSGSSGSCFFSPSIFVTLLPHSASTSGTPYLSLSVRPISEAGMPSFAILTMSISASFALSRTHDGAVFLSGFLEPDFPLFPEYIRAIVSPWLF